MTSREQVNIPTKINNQVLPSDVFGGFTWPFQGWNVTSISGIKRSRMEEAGTTAGWCLDQNGSRFLVFSKYPNASMVCILSLFCIWSFMAFKLAGKSGIRFISPIWNLHKFAGLMSLLGKPKTLHQSRPRWQILQILPENPLWNDFGTDSGVDSWVVSIHLSLRTHGLMRSSFLMCSESISSDLSIKLPAASPANNGEHSWPAMSKAKRLE